MSLESGARLGLYQISGLLGTGGMGEVYRARDTRLGRDVALKVLPASLAADVVHRERFYREARAVFIRRVAPEYLDLDAARQQLTTMLWADESVLEGQVSAYREALRIAAAESETAPVAHASDTGPSSIAVLPFANLSADPENESFGDGLAEEILNALNAVPGLTVIARTSAFAFRGKTDDVSAVTGG